MQRPFGRLQKANTSLSFVPYQEGVLGRVCVRVWE